MTVAVRKPLRLWPGVIAAVLLVLARYVIPLVEPGAILFGGIGGMVCVVAIVVWWLFFSRAPWTERILAIILIVVALFATSRIVHVSIRGGMRGMMLPLYATPILSLTLVAWAVTSRNLSGRARRVSMVASILLACGVFTLLR